MLRTRRRHWPAPLGGADVPTAGPAACIARGARPSAPRSGGERRRSGRRVRLTPDRRSAGMSTEPAAYDPHHHPGLSSIETRSPRSTTSASPSSSAAHTPTRITCPSRARRRTSTSSSTRTTWSARWASCGAGLSHRAGVSALAGEGVVRRRLHGSHLQLRERRRDGGRRLVHACAGGRVLGMRVQAAAQSKR